MIEAQRQYNPDLAALRRGPIQSQEFAAVILAPPASSPNAMRVNNEPINRCAASRGALPEGPGYSDWLGVRFDVNLSGVLASRHDIPTAEDPQCYEYASLLMAIDRVYDQKTIYDG